MTLTERISRYVSQRGLLVAGDGVLVAVSGGADSVALLHLLCELRDRYDLRLEIAHLQHGMRGADGLEDARFVEALARRLALPFHLQHADIPAIKARQGKGNLEAIARRERYGFFADLARRRGLAKVAVAHHRDDQVETVLMRALRGSGLKGIGGMAPVQSLIAGAPPAPLTVVRPLLEVAKADLIEYLSRINSDWRTDDSNADVALLRNWVRLELVPRIAARVGGGFADRLSRQAALLREDEELLEASAAAKLASMVRGEVLDRRALLGAPAALRRRILRLWIGGARGDLHGLGSLHVEQAMRLIENAAPHAELVLPGGCVLGREYDTLSLRRRGEGSGMGPFCYDLEIGATLSVAAAGWEFRSERVPAPASVARADLSEAVFDLGALSGPLTVRSFRAGDRFRPLGLQGRTRKVKDLLIDRKAPRSLRLRLPLLTMADEILWVPGFGRSEVAKVTADTREALLVRAKLRLVERRK